jgi:hypothetical protein
VTGIPYTYLSFDMVTRLQTRPTDRGAMLDRTKRFLLYPEVKLTLEITQPSNQSVGSLSWEFKVAGV